MGRKKIKDADGNPLPIQLGRDMTAYKEELKANPDKRDELLGRFKGKRNTNGFDKNPKNCGRKKKNKLTRVLQEILGDTEPVTPSDILDMQKMLMAASELQLLRMVECKDKDRYPVAICALATAMLNAMRVGNHIPIMAIIERVAGRAPQEVKIDANIQHTTLDLSKYSLEELDMMINLIEKGEENSDSASADLV